MNKLESYRLGILLIGLLLFWASCKRSVDLDPTDLIDPRDNQRYSTVVLGAQQWMAENLNFDLPESKINPDNPFTEYGRLYSYEQALIACPNGWHLPTDEDWNTMETAIGMTASELGFLGFRGLNLGAALKSSTEWIQNNGTNSLAFNAYPAGIYSNSDTAFQHIAENAYFWTASNYNNSSALYRGLSRDFNGVYRHYDNKLNSFSCRCVRDE